MISTQTPGVEEKEKEEEAAAVEDAFWNWEELHWAITHQPLHFQRANPRGRVGVRGGYVVSYALMGDYTC